MPDIFHDFAIRADADAVFHAISTPVGLDSWWTKESIGMPIVGAPYQLRFGKGCDWEATVYNLQPGRSIGWVFTQADEDWSGTRVAIHLNPTAGSTQVRFQHLGWATANEHYRTSCFCWAMYLRLLRRHVECSEFVPYEQRLDV